MRIEDLRRALGEKDLPAPYIDRVCREVEEHLQDARAELIGQGVSGAEAARLAAERMGDPVDLARKLNEHRLRGCVWLRHPAATALGLPIALFLGLAAVQLMVFVALIDWIPERNAAVLQVGAKLLLAMAGLLMLEGMLRHRLSRRWIGLSLLTLLIVCATSVVKVESQGQRMSATLRLIP